MKGNEAIKDIYKVQDVLICNQMNITQRNISKLCGVSSSKMNRDFKWEELVVDPLFGVVSIEDIPSIFMNRITPIKYREIAIYNNLFKGHGTGFFYIHPSHMNQKCVPSINELILGRLLVPILNVPPIDFSTINVADVVSVLIVGTLTKLKYYHHSLSFQKRSKFASHLLYCIQSICRSDTIYSQSSAYKYLQNEDKLYKFTKLFERYGSYQVGIKGYRQRLTSYSIDTLFPEVIKVFEELDIGPPKRIDISDIIVPSHILVTVKPKDMFYLLSLCKGKTDEGYIIRNNVQDTQYSRKYSVITSISSDTRDKLGYIGYDISACLQSIALNILDRKAYPIHSMLMRNKHRIRAVLMARLDKTLPQVKEILSAADNGKKYKRLKEKSRLLSRYIDEAESLADNLNEWMEKTNSARYEIAFCMAKDEWIPTRTYDSKTGKKQFKKSGNKNKYSLFFFCWTQIERDIREVMMSCVDVGAFVHEVHDAIYVHRDELQPKIKEMELAIQNELGLEIKVET